MSDDTGATVCDLTDWLGESGDGVHWSLDPPSDLNVNLVRLEPGHSIGEHVNRTADVALIVVAGSGLLCCDGVEHALESHRLAHIPKGTRRRIEAGGAGLAYVTLHRRRSLTIGTENPAATEG